MQHVQKERAEAHARRAALEQLQKRVQGDGKVGEWLRRHTISTIATSRCGSRCTSNPAGKTPSRRVLRERLNALVAKDVRFRPGAKDRPGSKLTLLLPVEGTAGDRIGTDSLLVNESAATIAKLAAILADWLHDVHAVPDLPAGRAR